MILDPRGEVRAGNIEDRIANCGKADAKGLDLFTFAGDLIATKRAFRKHSWFSRLMGKTFVTITPDSLPALSGEAPYDPHYDPLTNPTPGQGREYAPTYWIATAGPPPADDGPIASDI